MSQQPTRLRIRRAPFAQVANAALRDARLTFKARGVLAWLVSHGDGFLVCQATIERASEKDGRESVKTATAELEALGYIRRRKVQTVGKAWRYEYDVRDDLATPFLDDDPTAENPHTPHCGKSAHPTAENPHTKNTKENTSLSLSNSQPQRASAESEAPHARALVREASEAEDIGEFLRLMFQAFDYRVPLLATDAALPQLLNVFDDNDALLRQYVRERLADWECLEDERPPARAVLRYLQRDASEWLRRLRGALTGTEERATLREPSTPDPNVIVVVDSAVQVDEAGPDERETEAEREKREWLERYRAANKGDSE